MPPATTSPATIDRFETLFQQHHADPYPMYRGLRARGPVVVDPDGTVVVLSFPDARAALLAPEISVEARHSRWHQQSAAAGSDASFIELDPPRHTRLRRPVGQAFAARAAAAGPLVRQVVDDCLDRAPATGQWDPVPDFAYAVPIGVLCELVGVPRADRAQVQDWSHLISRAMDPAHAVDPAEVERATGAFNAYLGRLVADRARTPGDDLASDLLGSAQDGDRLTPDEVAGALGLLLISGHETTGSLISSGLYSLVTDPELRERVGAHRGLLPSLVDELLRLTPLVQFLFRYAKADLSLPCGTRLSKGDTVVVMLAAANRDPEHFPDPDAIRLDRTGPQHLSLGAGTHYCLGATLGRLQARTALAGFLDRVVEPELVEEPQRGPRALGGLMALPIRFTAVTAAAR